MYFNLYIGESSQPGERERERRNNDMKMIRQWNDQKLEHDQFVQNTK